MKKILVLAFLASLTVSPLWADELVAKTNEELPSGSNRSIRPQSKVD